MPHPYYLFKLFLCLHLLRALEGHFNCALLYFKEKSCTGSLDHGKQQVQVSHEKIESWHDSGGKGYYGRPVREEVGGREAGGEQVTGLRRPRQGFVTSSI